MVDKNMRVDLGFHDMIERAIQKQLKKGADRKKIGTRRMTKAITNINDIEDILSDSDLNPE